MTRTLHRLLPLLCLWLGLGGRVAAADPSAFLQGNEHLAAGRFDQAIKAYEAAGTGRTSAALENNRGLAYLGAGKPGAALAHLRLALALEPRDKEIQSNVGLARRRASVTTDVAGASERGPLALLRLNEWAALALGAAWVWFALFLWTRFSPGAAAALRGLPVLAATAAVALTAVLFVARAQRHAQVNIIALDPGADVQISPFAEARKVFTSPAGQELRLRGRQPGWLMVEDPTTGRYGWTRSAAVSATPVL